MATLIMHCPHCPHCPARHSTFTIRAEVAHSQQSSHFINLATCGNCGDGILVHSKTYGTGIKPSGLAGNLLNNKFIAVLRIDPRRSNSAAPEGVPSSAAQAFEEGCESWTDGRYSSAVAMFRRSLEIALKQFSPDVDAWKLEKRIDKLAGLHLITQDMKDWAHEIRLVGNEALHEEEVPTKEEAEDLMLFNEMLLTYLYTLPAKVKARRKKEGEA